MPKNDLQTLKELAEMVTRNKVKSIDVLSKKGPDTKIYDFYERLLDDSFTNDADAADYFYKDDSHHPQYRKLKNKLKEKLINTSFFIDTNSPKFNTHQRAFYTCQRNLMAVRTLIGRYARKPAIEIALDTLNKSIKFEFSEISFELCKTLRAHYSNHEQNQKLYEKYAELARHYKNITEAEDLVVERYDHLSILTLKSRNRKSVVEHCQRYEKEILPYTKKYDAYRLHLIYYFIVLKRLDLIESPQAMIDFCNGAINFLSAKGFVSNQFIGAFYYNKLMASIQIRDFETSNFLAQKCTSLFENDTIRWYRAYEFHFILSLHSRNYRKALSIRQKVTDAPTFGNQFLNVTESWRLYDAYLHYLYLNGKMTLPKSSTLSSFRLRKFMNEVPVFSMDKSGSNIPILVVQILLQIQQKKFDQLTDKIEAIEKYTTRYLRKANNYRSNCFIKMLLQIPKQHFHQVAVERHTRLLLSKLKSMPLAQAKQPFEIEIIPYEDLWEIALESIG